MRRPIRRRLYAMADLAIAFATLEAVRLPQEAERDADDRRPVGARHCIAPADCSPSPRRRNQSAHTRTPRAAHR